MTDALDAAEKRAHEALNAIVPLPARDGGYREVYLKAHAAIRDLRREAYRQGVADASIPGFVKERP